MKILGLLLFLIETANSARILGVFQMPSLSHQCVFQPIWRELSLRGHHVVVVSPNPLRDPKLTNLTEIDVNATNYEIMQRYGFQYFMNKQYTVQSKIHNIFQLNYDLAEAIFQTEEFVKIYNSSDQHFDLVIAQTYISPILFSLSARFDAPLIGVASMGGWIGSHFAMGNPTPPSLYSEMFLHYHGLMSFYERFKSFLYYWWAKYYTNFVAIPKSDRIARKYLGEDMPYLGDIERNMSLLLLSTNPVLYMPRPTVPTIISLEHMHIKPVKPLPQDLKSFLDNAKEGVIYFSLGSNVKSVNIPIELRTFLIETFAELPYKILWKFESETLPNQPKNVFISKWLPQQDVLAHPNVKVFFTQCGLQSIEEAVSRGVPMVGMPFIADQTMNIKRLEHYGVAIGVDYLTVTKEQLTEALIKVATDAKYKINIEKLKDLWLDHPMPSLERAIWWIEYALRHKGTKHLRSPTVDVSWIEYLLIDVIAVLLLGIMTVAFLAKFLVKLALMYLIPIKKNKAKVN